ILLFIILFLFVLYLSYSYYYCIIQLFYHTLFYITLYFVSYFISYSYSYFYITLYFVSYNCFITDHSITYPIFIYFIFLYFMFIFIFIIELLCKEFYLMTGDGNYMFRKDGIRNVTITEKISEADKFDIIQTTLSYMYTKIVVKTQDNLYWDISANKTNLHYWHKDLKKEQQFFFIVYLENGEVGVLNANMQCLAYKPALKIFQRENCMLRLDVNHRFKMVYVDEVDMKDKMEMLESGNNRLLDKNKMLGDENILLKKENNVERNEDIDRRLYNMLKDMLDREISGDKDVKDAVRKVDEYIHSDERDTPESIINKIVAVKKFKDERKTNHVCRLDDREVVDDGIMKLSTHNNHHKKHAHNNHDG
ncbi:hypothetical protein SLOPH_544, partial [Spraguea lophii 42_110]